MISSVITPQIVNFQPSTGSGSVEVSGDWLMQKYSANFFQSKQQKPRKSSLLPYPLPDVYGTEVYDPHGLFQAKVKTETTEIELSGDSNDLVSRSLSRLALSHIHP